MFSVIGKELITAPAAPSDVPAHLREYLNLIAGVDTDAFLTSLFLRAVGIVEDYTNLTLLQTVFRLTFSGDGSYLRLPLFPVTSAASLSAAADSVQPGSFTLRPAPGYSWALAFDRELRGIYTVDITAGYTSFAVAPPAAVAAVYAIAADLYEHREAQQEGTLTESRTIRTALDSIRRMNAGAVG